MNTGTNISHLVVSMVHRDKINRVAEVAAGSAEHYSFPASVCVCFYFQVKFRLGNLNW